MNKSLTDDTINIWGFYLNKQVEIVYKYQTDKNLEQNVIYCN